MQNCLAHLLYRSSVLLLFISSVLFAEVSNEQNSHEKKSATKIIKPFIAKYDLLKKSDSVGEATRQLNYPDELSANYRYKTEASWFIFSDVREETSITKVNDSKITPTHYLFERKGTGRDKKYEWTYDVENDFASDLKKEKKLNITFPEKIQDKLSYQLQLRLDLIINSSQELYTYPVISTSGAIKDYTFVNEGEKIITLPYGEIKTVKLKRETKDKKKITYAWFAPDLNYLLVKLSQIKNGKEQFSAELKTVDLINTKGVETASAE